LRSITDYQQEEKVNKWQMAGNTLTWDKAGGIARDNHNNSHRSIHPLGRSEDYRRKQRKVRHAKPAA
jgi:hypothetical protein